MICPILFTCDSRRTVHGTSHEMDGAYEQKETDRATVAQTITVHLRIPLFLSMYVSQIS